MKKIVIIASTSGSILSKTLVFSEIKEHIFEVISDRYCGAIEYAKKNGIKTKVLLSYTGLEFSNKLLEYFRNKKVDCFLSFYTRIFAGDFLTYYFNRIYNFHPSLLPASPGKDGFGDTLKSGCKFFGSTLHLVDANIDTGLPVMQSVHPFQPSLTINQNRNLLFIQQCKIFIQFILWFSKGRIKEETVIGAQYLFNEFVPNLEDDLALNFNEKFDLN
jgi:phosphoribosylglycinamide formyltransferase-1